MSNEYDPFAPNGTTAKFENVGDTHVGVVVSIGSRQERAYGTNELKVWPDGNPVMQAVIGLSVEGQDLPTMIYCKPAARAAIRDAVAAVGAPTLEVGGMLALQLTGFAAPSAPGMTGAKQFVAQYRAPARAAGADLFNAPAQPAQPAQPAVMQAPAPVAPPVIMQAPVPNPQFAQVDMPPAMPGVGEVAPATATNLF